MESIIELVVVTLAVPLIVLWPVALVSQKNFKRNKAMKKCQYCAESIQEDAKKCRYCGEWMADNSKKNVSSEDTTNEEGMSKKEWSTDKTINKVVIALFPVLALFISIFSFIDSQAPVSLVYLLFAYFGWDNFNRRRIDGKTWYVRRRWAVWLAWAVCVLFSASIGFAISILVNAK